MGNFWQELKKPIIALAPMAGVTDFAFRTICENFGADVLYSEMANVTALTYQPKKTLKMLGGKNGKTPYIVQLFGNNPEYFTKAVKIIEKEINPDGIDINFGCPASKVMKTGAGAELMKDLNLSFNIIDKTIKNTKLPVSIKIRAKSGKVHAIDLVRKINKLDVKAIMIHGRTLSQGFSGNINVEVIKEIKEEFNGIVLANGGINNRESAQKVLGETGVDGLGIARGCMGNPWLFSEIKNKNTIKTTEQVFYTALKHAILMYKHKGEHGILEMRKHLCWYVQGMKNASEMRGKLVHVKTIDDIEKIFAEYKKCL